MSIPPAPDAPRRPTELTAHGDVRIDDWYWLRERDNGVSLLRTTMVVDAIRPVLIGALALLIHSPRGSTDLAAAAGLLLLACIHSVYWWDPWHRTPQHAVAALGTMVVINFALLNLLGLAEPLLWLYPALVAGAGFLEEGDPLCGIALQD